MSLAVMQGEIIQPISGVRVTDFVVKVGEISQRRELDALVLSGVQFPLMICPHKDVLADDFIAHNPKNVGFAFDAAQRIAPIDFPLTVYRPLT